MLIDQCGQRWYINPVDGPEDLAPLTDEKCAHAFASMFFKSIDIIAGNAKQLDRAIQLVVLGVDFLQRREHTLRWAPV